MLLIASLHNTLHRIWNYYQIVLDWLHCIASRTTLHRIVSHCIGCKNHKLRTRHPSSETNHCFLIAAGVSAEGSSLLWVDRQLQQIQILHITSTNTNTLPVQFLQKVVPSWLKTKGITTSIVFLILSWSTTAKKTSTPVFFLNYDNFCGFHKLQQSEYFKSE